MQLLISKFHSLFNTTKNMKMTESKIYYLAEVLELIKILYSKLKPLSLMNSKFIYSIEELICVICSFVHWTMACILYDRLFYSDRNFYIKYVSKLKPQIIFFCMNAPWVTNSANSFTQLHE